MRYIPLLAASFAALALGACGKKPPAAPEAPLTQVKDPTPEKPGAPEVPSAPDKDRKLPAEADRKAPIDRTETIQATLAGMEKGDFGQAFKYLDKDVDWVEVGLPDGELDSVEQIIAYQQKTRTGFSDFKVKAKRIIEAADYQVVEYVWSATHTGAFADGTAATNKTVSLPAALLIRYQENGLIDKVWSFQDWPNVLRQLALAPDLPADFVAATMPTKTDIVIGANEPRYREQYVGFLGALGPNDYLVAMNERATADFAWFDLGSGQRVTKHDGSNTYLADRRGSFVRDSTEVETAIGAGPIFAAYVTNKLTYKGGYLGVPADNQKVTTHTLDIVEFDPSNLRLKTLASYGNSYEIMGALGVNAGAAPRVAMSANMNIKACDDYIEDMRECIGSLAEVTRAATGAVLDQQIVTWKADLAASKTIDEVKRSCEAAAAAGRSSYAAQCPRTTWD